MEITPAPSHLATISKQLWVHFNSDSLFRNSAYLMLSTGVLSVFGFIFWLVNARLFSTTEIGLATTLISVSALISNLSLLGLNSGLIRFLPKTADKNSLINACLALVGGATLLISIAYLIGIHTFSPKLEFIAGNATYVAIFLVSMIFISVSPVIESIYIAHRSSGFVFLKNSVFSLTKIALPVIFVSLGAFGIFSSVAFAFFISVVFSIFYLVRKFSYAPVLKSTTVGISHLWKFSSANYIISVISGLPSLLLPIIIINKLDPSISGFFYIDMMIVNLLFTIPIATTQAFLAEGAHNTAEIKTQLKKSFAIIALILLPAALFIFFFGHIVLSFFGKAYAEEGVELLQLLTISSVFSTAAFIGNVLLNIRHQTAKLVFINTLGTALTLSLSFYLINNGLLGIGFAFLISQVVVSFFHIYNIQKEFFYYESK